MYARCTRIIVHVYICICNCIKMMRENIEMKNEIN